MNFTYIVQCKDNSLYTGWTNNLKKRIYDHNNTKVGAKYTRTKGPVALVYYEAFETKSLAMSREAYIKKLSRNKKLELINF